MLIPSFNKAPAKNMICGSKSELWGCLHANTDLNCGKQIIQHCIAHTLLIKTNTITNSTVPAVNFHTMTLELTVCKSLLKSISVINPTMMASGAKLHTARNLPITSPAMPTGR